MESHRADVRTDCGIVVEFQHSPLSVDDIRVREKFYGNMVWIIDTEPFSARFQIHYYPTHETFEWNRPKVSWSHANRPMFLDMTATLGPEYLFYLRRIHAETTPWRGWGKLIATSRFVETISQSQTVPYEPAMIERADSVSVEETPEEKQRRLDRERQAALAQRWREERAWIAEQRKKEAEQRIQFMQEKEQERLLAELTKQAAERSRQELETERTGRELELRRLSYMRQEWEFWQQEYAS